MLSVDSFIFQENMEKLSLSAKDHEEAMCRMASEQCELRVAYQRAKERQEHLEATFKAKHGTLAGIKQSALGDWHLPDSDLLPESVRHYTGDKDDRKALMAFQRERAAATKSVVTQVGFHGN